MNKSNAEIAQSVLDNKGGSYYLLPHGLVEVTERDGDVYAVGGALNKYEESIASLFVKVDEFDFEAVQMAIDYVAHHRLGLHNEWAGVGFWIDDEYPDMVCIDAIDIVQGRILAEQLGRQRGELAIYGIQHEEVVSI